MKISLRTLQDGFILLVLFFATCPFLTSVSGGNPVGGLGIPLFRAVWYFVYFVIMLYSVTHLRLVAALFMANKAILLLLLLAVISTYWALDPGYTFRHSITLFATTLTGAYFAIHYTPQQQARFVLFAITVAIIMSVVGELVFPSLLPPFIAVGVDPDSTAWHGIYAHKNVLGRIVAVALIGFFSLYPNLKHNYVRALLVTVAIGLVILKSHSTTALIVSFATIVLVKAARFLLWTPKRVFYVCLALSILVCGVIYSLATSFDSMMLLIGKDATLTGRTTLWKLLIEQVKTRPFLGFGFESFWVSGISERIKGASFEALHAHNGMLDLMLSLGLVGVLLFIIAYGVTLRRVIQAYRQGPSPAIFWQLSLLIYLLLLQISESIFTSFTPLFWMLFVATAFSTCSVLVTGEVEETANDRESTLFASPAISQGGLPV